MYIEAHSPELTELHRKLVTVFEPSEEQTMQCFELDLYTPHICGHLDDAVSQDRAANKNS